MSQPYPESLQPDSPQALDSRGRRLVRIFLFALVGCLMLGAILAIVSLVTMRMSEFQGRILLTTFSLGVYSLLGLCCSFLIERKRYAVFGMLGVVVAFCGVLFAVATTWEAVSSFQFVIQGRICFLVVASSFGHASLLLLLETKQSLVIALRWGTILMIAAVAGLLVILCLDPSLIESLWLFLALTGVIDVFGTVSTPLLHLATRKPS